MFSDLFIKINVLIFQTLADITKYTLKIYLVDFNIFFMHVSDTPFN